MPEFFLELLSEEVPSRMQAPVAEAIRFSIETSLAKLCAKGFKTYYGPRRIAVTGQVAAETIQNFVEVRGPREGAPHNALEGFARRQGALYDELILEKGYWWLRQNMKPIPAIQFLKEISLSSTLTSSFWPKSMRWGTGGNFFWVRPLRQVVCLLDGKVIPFMLGPVVAGNETLGHRALRSEKFAVFGYADWRDKLLKHHVVADQQSRREIICTVLQIQADELDLLVVHDDELVEEVAGLVEWPVPLIGNIDASFMSLPPEVRELSMKVNQKYFALRDAESRPAPYFGFIANLNAPDGGAAIVAGNERVLRARLADARHFWELDLRTPLNDLLPKLESIVFHARIGSQRERAERVAALADLIAGRLGGDSDAAQWAGLLCKADLVTGMVGEFPELQGVMGGYYAERNPRGWDGVVVGAAIRTHYQPKGPNDAVPTGIVPVSVALADKLDTLVQFFRIGEAPTGSGDPYALRRAALGVIRIILENELRLPLRPLLGGNEKLFSFIMERLRVKLRGEGQRFDVLDAVLGVRADDDLLRVMRRVNALTDFLNTSDGADLLVLFRRADNILKIEDAKDGPHLAKPVDGLLELPEEQELNRLLAHVSHATILEYRVENYDKAMSALATLRAVVDRFFDKVTVNAPAPALRGNRLKLLALLREVMYLIADFSRIQA